MRVFLRIAVIVLLVGLTVAVGNGIWDAGYDQGVIDAAESTEIIVTQQHRGGFFPFGAMFGFFFLFLFFGMMFKFAFGWRHWGRHHKGSGPDGYRANMEERMSSWHDKAHGNPPSSEAPSEPQSPVS